MGAYGAGVLAGLAAANNVPAFSLVTGISIGAMLAPRLFMGEYTEARNFYTNLTDSDIYRMRSVGELLIANSLVDTAPLRAKVAAIITQDFVDRLARENAERHRVPAVQSVDLDAGTWSSSISPPSRPVRIIPAAMPCHRVTASYTPSCGGGHSGCVSAGVHQW